MYEKHKHRHVTKGGQRLSLALLIIHNSKNLCIGEIGFPRSPSYEGTEKKILYKIFDYWKFKQNCRL